MEFGLSDHQVELQERASDVVHRLVVPEVEASPPDETLCAERVRRIYRGLAPLGYLSGTLPTAIGGHGMSHVDYGLLLEALAQAPVLLSEVVLPRLIHRLGDGRQQERWLPGLLEGESISTSAITEPQAGSDVRNLQMSLERTGQGWRLNGRKKWIKLGGVSDLMALLVNNGPSATTDRARTTTRVIVERSVSPWSSVEIGGVGMRNLSWAELTFDEVPVPAENILGDPGASTDAFYRGMEASRAFVAIEAVGVAGHALKLATDYVRSRTAFGRTLARFQDVQTRLADAAAALDAARLLCLRALAMLDDGFSCPREASMAKVFATETAVGVCSASMDSMGAHGLSVESDVERCWRDARMLTVIDGTSAIQRLIVGRELLGEHAFV